MVSRVRINEQFALVANGKKTGGNVDVDIVEVDLVAIAVDVGESQDRAGYGRIGAQVNGESFPFTKNELKFIIYEFFVFDMK